MAKIYYMVLEMPQCSLKFLTCTVYWLLICLYLSFEGKKNYQRRHFSCDMEYVCSVGYPGICYWQAEPQYHLSFFGLSCPMNNTSLTGSAFSPPCFLLLS